MPRREYKQPQPMSITLMVWRGPAVQMREEANGMGRLGELVLPDNQGSPSRANAAEATPPQTKNTRR
jgi:hypothetical protein